MVKTLVFPFKSPSSHHNRLESVSTVTPQAMAIPDSLRLWPQQVAVLDATVAFGRRRAQRVLSLQGNSVDRWERWPESTHGETSMIRWSTKRNKEDTKIHGIFGVWYKPFMDLHGMFLLIRYQRHCDTDDFSAGLFVSSPGRRRAGKKCGWRTVEKWGKKKCVCIKGCLLRTTVTLW